MLLFGLIISDVECTQWCLQRWSRIMCTYPYMLSNLNHLFVMPQVLQISLNYHGTKHLQGTYSGSNA